MKILWLPQISSKDEQGNVMLHTDSNISFLMNLLSSEFVKENIIDVAFDFGIEYNNNNFKIITSLYNRGIRYIFKNNRRNFTNAYLERLCFDEEYMMGIKDVNGYVDYDIIFTNEPTKVISLKHIFKKSKIACYCHWLAMDNMKEIELRQIEGMMAADICFVNSSYVIERILSQYMHLDGIENINIVKLQPAFENCNILKQKQNAKLNIIYNHRISSDPYYTKAFETMLEVMDNIHDKLKDTQIDMPTVYLTNPSGKTLKQEYKRNYIKMLNLSDKQEYKEFLQSDEISIHLNTFFESKGMWSISTVDCAITGNICLLPNMYGYAEIFDKNYYGYVSCKEELENKLIEHILNNKGDYTPYGVEKHNNVLLSKKLNLMLKNVLNKQSNNIVEKPWGYYETLEKNKFYCKKMLLIKKGEKLSLQKHLFRRETFNVVTGEGILFYGKDEENIKEIKMVNDGTSYHIDKNEYHSIQAITEMVIKEVSCGNLVCENDIIRVDDKYGRV